MASILLLRGGSTDGSAPFVSAMTARGHTVTETTTYSASGLDAEWGAGFDMVALFDSYTLRRDWVVSKWDAGVPALIAHSGWRDTTAPTFGVTTTTMTGSTAGDIMDVVTPSHPVASGYSGSVTVRDGLYTSYVVASPAGTVLGAVASGDASMGAIEAGGVLADASPAPARLVWCSWWAPTPTSDGDAIMGNAVDWLAPPVGPEITASVEHSWTAAATLQRDHFVAALTSHEWTATATLDAGTPTQITATASHSWTATVTLDAGTPTQITATASHSWTATVTLDNGAEVAATATHSWAVAATLENGEVRSIAAAVSHVWTVTALLENGETTLDGWTRDNSQQVVFDVTGPDTNPAGPLLIDRTPLPAPEDVTERPIMLHSPQPTVADFTVSANGSVHSKGQWDITEDVVGVPHVWVDGLDVTYFRGVPIILDDVTAAEPYGWETATLTLPQVSAWEQLGVGDLAWLRPDAQVEAHIVHTDEETGVRTKVHELFSGHLVSDGARATESETATVWDCAGDTVAGAYYLHRPPIQMKPTDLGTLIPQALNSVVSRRYGTVPKVKTGIESTNRGSGDDYVTERTSELLAVAWTDAGEQWTIARTNVLRQYEMRLKDTTTAHWSVVLGTPGVAIRLDADHASRSDAVMGRGVGPDGYAWSGRYWPSLLAYDPPDYPNNNAGDTINPGESDANTDSGDGVSVWEQRAADLGYDVPVDGYLSAGDSQVVRDIQSRMGLQVDGIIGPQTWTGTWEVGVDSAALESLRLPLAWRPEVEPHLYGAQGNVTGPNPAYDPRVIRRERAIDYGAQVTKREGIASARREVARSADPGWHGEITLAVDPMEGSRFAIDEGDNILARGWRGTDQLCHIAKVRRSLTGGTVTLTVDTKARDAMDLASLRRRDREAQIDPARRPGNVNRKSRQSHDLRTVFEGDSPAGRVHRRALFAGLWSVFPVPISEAGEIVKLTLDAESPATVFSLGFFAAPVQPSHVLRLVGNPAADSEAWRKRLPELEDLGFIEAWGAGESMAGHWPSQAGPVTGKLRDTGGWSYWSDHGGWVWVAAWAPVSTFIKGRVFPAPID